MAGHKGSRSSAGQLNQALADAVARNHTDVFGRGPSAAYAFYHRNVVVVMLADALTKAERSLADAGRQDEVLHTRQQIQGTMRSDLTLAVDELTGCRIEAFMTANHIRPDVAAELFVLDRSIVGEAPSAWPGSR
jgi:uncharacterized protein YbcI